MNMREKRWLGIVTACNASGMKKKEWLQIHNISSKSFYRWQKILRERALEETEEFGYPIVPDYKELSSPTRAREEEPGFVDVTAIVGKESHEIKTDSTVKYHQQMATPELMLQVGQYSLYIGSGITESTLKTVLGVIRNA